MWELLGRIIRILNTVGINYMLVGSFAANMHGHSRATHDIDFVVKLYKQDLPKLKALFNDDYMFDEYSANEAIEAKDMFNVIDFKTMDKIDFWIQKDTDFAQTQFLRRIKQDFEETYIWIESVEDTILSKLLWYKMSNSERQLNDVKAILLANPKPDWQYLNLWAEKVGVMDSLLQLKSETDYD